MLAPFLALCWTFRSAATKFNRIAVAFYLEWYRDEFQRDRREAYNREAYRQFLCACLEECVLFDDPRALHTLANVTGILEFGYDGIGDARTIVGTLYSTALHRGSVGLVTYTSARSGSSLLARSTQVLLTGLRAGTVHHDKTLAMGGVLRLRLAQQIVMP